HDADDVNIDVLVLDDPDVSEELAARESSDLDNRWAEPGSGARLGYVISTSGSTGRPKPALVPMAGFCNMMVWFRGQLSLEQGDGVLVSSAPGFDLTQKTVWGTLSSGGAIHLAVEGFEPQSILRQIADNELTVVNMAPGAFEIVAELESHEELASVRTIALGGEAVKAAPLKKFLDRGVRCHNSYGPTEASDIVTSYVIQPADAVSDQLRLPIGPVLDNVALYVLDGRLRRVPDGMTCTAPATSCVAETTRTTTSWAVPTSRSRFAGCVSNSARSSSRCSPTPTSTRRWRWCVTPRRVSA
ncbi:MAG: hypothetical protein EOO27_29255, partial [Comamonadaceae bacterium]